MIYIESGEPEGEHWVDYFAVIQAGRMLTVCCSPESDLNYAYWADTFDWLESPLRIDTVPYQVLSKLPECGA